MQFTTKNNPQIDVVIS